MTPNREPLDLATVQQRLGASRGKDYWRSLEELAQADGFEELLQREFPRQAGEWTDPLSRRRFLMLMGASLALAGLAGCSPAPLEKIVPYVRAPEQIVPGRPLYFATAMPLAGYGLGLLVESHEGRPTKVEGNANHPANPLPPDSPPHARLGPTDLFAPASVLTLYDPDRSQTVTHLGEIATWDAFVAALRATLAPRTPPRVRILTETVTSPALARQLRRLVGQNSSVKWHLYEPIGTENARAGARLALQGAAAVQYRFEQADVILSLDADFLACGPGQVRHARDFSARRRVRQGRAEPPMNRLYVVECSPTVTGAKADHRLPLQASRIEPFTRAIATEVRMQLQTRPGAAAPTELADVQGATVSPEQGRWIAALVRDLLSHRGRSVVVAGEAQPPFVHGLACALNFALGNVGNTVSYTDPVEVEPPGQRTSLGDLVTDMEAGQVDVLLILGGNPVYTAPADLRFREAMDRVGLRVHLGLYQDETTAASHWHIPEAHYLESWGDVRAHDGTVSIIQPLIAPLYGGKSIHEVLALLTDHPERTSYEIVRAFWRSPEAAALFETGQAPGGDFEAWWRQALHDGFIDGTRLPAHRVTLRPGWAREAAARTAEAGQELEIVFRPDPTVFDGRFANNGWLQELPKPLSRLTWDNAAFLSPQTAVRLGFAEVGHPEQANGQLVALDYRGRTVQAPLWVLPGHANDSVTVHLGYGRTRCGRVGTGVGFDAYRLRTATAPWFDSGLSLRRTGQHYPLACVQHHHLMEGRDLVRSGTVQHLPVIPPPPRRALTMYHEGEHQHAGEQWGMVIDLSLCVGCGACVAACQAENNIPVVGKDQVSRGREMHWLRIDTYYVGGSDNPETFFQPVPCMHCENAPCEQVCPVGATVHSDDGLNDMVYNRCVGTRYCSNNCPYKVRRFNFLQYADFATESLRLQRNPEVTVRSRGVMEKCTYCVQRIRSSHIEAQLADRPIRDGEVQTACQAACPAGAIIFGNLTDRDQQGRPVSKVARLQTDPLNYSMLAELNTRPRTTYLAALRNPNPEIVALERG